MSSDKFFSLFGKIILLAIVIGAVAFGAYYFGTQKSKNLPLATPTAAPTNEIPTITPEVTTSVATPTVDETEVLKNAVQAALVAKHGASANSLVISVSKIEGDYASGGATEEAGGGAWFAAKVAGVWKLVWDGNGVIMCTDLASYPAFPTSMIPECWDEANQKNVKR